MEDRIKDYLKGAQQGDETKKRQARKFVSTVTGNVQHAWTSLIKAGEEVLGKKELKPEAYKKRMDSIISTVPHQVGHIGKADPRFAEAKSDMAKQMKKEQKLYAEIYEKVVKARAPLISGSAAQAVPTFRDARPDQLKARTQQQMQ